MDTSDLQALQRAIAICGSQGELAKAISTPEKVIKQQHVWNWLNRDNKVPAEMAIPIERATVPRDEEGAPIPGAAPRVTRFELRPDIYPVEEAA